MQNGWQKTRFALEEQTVWAESHQSHCADHGYADNG